MKKAQLSLIGILAALLIIGLLSYYSFKAYFKPVDKQTKETLTQENIDTTNYQTVADSARQKVNEINKKMQNRAKELGVE